MRSEEIMSGRVTASANTYEVAVYNGGRAQWIEGRGTVVLTDWQPIEQLWCLLRAPS